VCLQCLVEAETLAEVLPRWWVARAMKTYKGEWEEGEYGLVRCNDPDLIWDGEPRPDPSFGRTDEEVEAETDEQWRDAEAWLREASEFCNSLRTTGGMYRLWELVQDAKAYGYDRDEHGSFEYWLFHQMGVAIQEQRKFTPDRILEG
jgi:hypothetical protein